MWRYMLLALTLAGCAGGQQPPPGIEQGLAPDLAEARRLLLGSAGPLPLALDRAPTVLGADPGSAAARAASRGTEWAAASFRPTAGEPDGPRLVLRFADDGRGTPCAVPVPPPRFDAAPQRVLAVLCDGQRVVAEAVGRSDSGAALGVETMITEATERLFPPLARAGVAGWSPGIAGISLGGWVGSGGRSGVGVGVGF
jgi:hypothetical protein